MVQCDTLILNAMVSLASNNSKKKQLTEIKP